MTDRFANGDPGNDAGGYAVPPGTAPAHARLITGLDPTDKGFYHGGDLVGITSKLDYIKGLGSTAIWLTPSFKNRPVQGTGGGAQRLPGCAERPGGRCCGTAVESGAALRRRSSGERDQVSLPGR